ncbi:MAG: beta-ketoacyl-ACP synthase III [Candidatus Limivivens sp.]|nr:beta-ketoacyl-ACP synthase III [Candidatus Limivivens sp.]
MRVKIIGTGSALPEKIVTNDMLSRIVETNDEWISSRTGIRERRIAGKETTADLAISAARRALENSGCGPEEIELILVATFTPERCAPNTACEVQAALGCTNAAAFDVNAACSGFLFALNTAQAYVAAGICRTILLVGAEKVSRVVDWKDRSTCVLFGDGAGAAVVQAREGCPMVFLQYSDGSQGQVLTCRERVSGNPWHEEEVLDSHLQMDGQAVFRFAVRRVPECIQALLEKAGKSVRDVDWFLLHQANRRILDAVAKRLDAKPERFPMNLNRYGNTSAASLPILLDEVNRSGRLQEGELVVLSGFGAGLTWGAALLEW